MKSWPVTLLLGILFLGAAWSLAKGWELLPLGIYAFFTGLTGVLIGVRIINLGLTAGPLVSGVGFILTGSGGIFAGAVLLNRRTKWLRIVGAAVLIAAALIWARTAYLGYWAHLHP